MIPSPREEHLIGLVINATGEEKQYFLLSLLSLGFCGDLGSCLPLVV